MPKRNERERRCCENRRYGHDRRALIERRQDYRTPGQIHKPFLFWIRSLTHPRLGVDRRKGRDRRMIFNDRRQVASSILSSEEIAALLGDN